MHKELVPDPPIDMVSGPEISNIVLLSVNFLGSTVGV